MKVKDLWDFYLKGLKNDKGETFFTLHKLLERIINNKSLEVYHYEEFEEDGKTKSKKISEQAPTNKALRNASYIKDAFSEFIFRNKAYRDQIENEYNQNINVFSTNKFEFEDFLETPFLNKDIVLRVHQKNAIFKGIMQNTLLLDHQVGAGKTLAGIALVMEQIRMNLIKKALILVPNHLSSAWAKEFIKAYPSAKILVGDKIDNKKARKEFLYRARNGDFDAIIMKHSTFENMNVMQSFQEEVIEEQMKSLSIQLADKKRLNETIRFKDTKRILEEIDKQINRFKMKLANLAKGKTFDDEIAFEDLGIDCLIVDEAHYLKKIYAFS